MGNKSIIAVVWQGTQRIGCAAVMCDKLEGLPYTDANFLVCQYWPAGNLVSTDPDKKYRCAVN